MLPDKPTSVTDWATEGDALKTDPPLAMQEYGWNTSDGTPAGDLPRPDLNRQNGWQNIVHQWVTYFDSYNTTVLEPATFVREIEKISITDLTDTDVDVGQDLFNYAGHGFETGDAVWFVAGSTFPAPLVFATAYWVIKIDDDNFRVATSRANVISNTYITITSTGTGPWTLEHSGEYMIDPADFRHTFAIKTSVTSNAQIYLPPLGDMAPQQNGQIYTVVNERRDDASSLDVRVFDTQVETINDDLPNALRLRRYGESITFLANTVPVIQVRTPAEDFYAWSVLSDTFRQGIYQTRKIVDEYFGSFLASSINLDDNTIALSLNGTCHNNDVVQLTTTGTLPAGLSLATDYYIHRIAPGVVQLATNNGGDPVDITDGGTGTHTMTTQRKWNIKVGPRYSKIVIDTNGNDHEINFPNGIDHLEIEKTDLGELEIIAPSINGSASISLFSKNIRANIMFDHDQNEYYSDIEEFSPALPSGDFTSGYIVFQLRGTLVTVKGNIDHSSSTLRDSAANFIPVKCRVNDVNFGISTGVSTAFEARVGYVATHTLRLAYGSGQSDSKPFAFSYDTESSS